MEDKSYYAGIFASLIVCGILSLIRPMKWYNFLIIIISVIILFLIEKAVDELRERWELIEREKDKLRIIMLKRGYKIISVPSGTGLIQRFTKQNYIYANSRIPYSTQISEKELRQIIQEMD